ncbi:MAG: ArnT family glycosyltransferase, partial [Planctomycetia bacterium]
MTSVPPLESSSVDSRWAFRGAVLLLALGAAARVGRWAVDFPLWGDEAMLAVNLWRRDYVDLVGPLDFWQVAPPLFLWIERAVVETLGFNEASLRLFPLVASLAALVVFWRLTQLALPPAGQAAAVAFLAAAHYPIRHAVEVKPYATDVLASVLLLWCGAEWLRGRNRYWLYLAAAIAPALLMLSFPAVFVAGGVAAALLPFVCHSRRSLPAYVLFGTAVGVTFLTLLWCMFAVTFHASGDALTSWWTDGFPPLGEPWKVPGWLLETHTGFMFAYPIGGRNGGSAATTLLAAAGFAALALGLGATRRQPGLAALLAAPFAVGLAAAVLGRYPYGGGERVVQYLAPSICLTAGAGVAFLLSRCSATT